MVRDLFPYHKTRLDPVQPTYQATRRSRTCNGNAPVSFETGHRQYGSVKLTLVSSIVGQMWFRRRDESSASYLATKRAKLSIAGWNPSLPQGQQRFYLTSSAGSCLARGDSGVCEPINCTQGILRAGFHALNSSPFNRDALL